MIARTKWITPKHRADQKIILAEEREGGDWWAQLDVTLTTRGALCLVRGEPTPIAAVDLPAGVVGTMTRTGLLAATVRVVSAEPDSLMDVLADLDLDAAERLHRYARSGGLR